MPSTLLPALVSWALLAAPPLPSAPFGRTAAGALNHDPTLRTARVTAHPADDGLEADSARFGGSGPFVGRRVVPRTERLHVEVGVDTQAAPLNIVLVNARDTLIATGVSNACATSSEPGCTADAQAYSSRALTVLRGLSSSEWSDVLAATADTRELAATLRTVGVTDSADITAVQDYVKTIPVAERRSMFSVARHVADEPAAVRLEPFASVYASALRVRVGVPISLGTSSALGNLNVDVAAGWTFPIRSVAFGLGVGVSTCLPTATGDEQVALMADLFQASKYVPWMLTFAPYVVGGLDAGWVSWLAHADVWVQAGVRAAAAQSEAEVLHYGTGVTFGPHFPLALILQLEGLEGLHNASEYGSLFGIAGLQASFWSLHLGVGVQAPLVDRASEDLGFFDGIDVGKLARITVLAHTTTTF